MLNMHDMDVARNKTTEDQAHWVLWNIPASATGVAEGMPKGATLAKTPRHHCVVDVFKAMPGHVLAKAVYGGFFRFGVACARRS